MVAHVRPTVGEPTSAAASPAWRYVALGRRVPDYSRRTPLSVASRGSRQPHPGYSRTPSAGQESRQEVLPEVAHGLGLRATGAPHGQAQKLRRRDARHFTGRGTSPTSLSPQPRGEVPPAHTSAGAAHAGVHSAGSCTAVPRRVWTQRPTFPPATTPTPRPHLSPPHDPTLPDLA
jgi:hypothetical protein